MCMIRSKNVLETSVGVFSERIINTTIIYSPGEPKCLKGVVVRVNKGEHVVAAFLDVGKLLRMFGTMDSCIKY